MTVLAQVAILLLLFALCWRIGLQRDQHPIVLLDDVLGLAPFARVPAASPGQAGLGRRSTGHISYQLHLTHFLVGASVMKLALLRFDWSPGPSLVAALLVTLAIALLLHRSVERPTIAPDALAKGFHRNPTR